MPSPTPLIIHCPRWDRQRREIMVMPLGLPALANLILDHTGTAPTLVHLGIENEHDPHFRLSELLSPSPPRLLLVSLHWFLQVRPVLDLVRELRSLAPESLVVLGGFTASYFAHEILSRVPSVDAVVVGDGEQPILALTRWASAIPALSRSRLNEIPNLVWRDTDGTIRRNPHRYVLGSSEAASLRHGSLSCLRHHQLYTERALYADFSEGSHESPYARTAYLNAGRGCSVACANCGGGKLAQAALGKRNGILVYPLSKLIRDIEESLSHGVDVLRMSFDPPSARRPMMAWFEAIAKLNPRFRLIYDLWWLPSKALLDSMARAFSPGSTLILSPECGSEAVRKRIRGYPFSNDHLMQAIHAIESRGFRTHCFFSAGLPTESPDDLEETIGLIQRIRGETQAGISVCPMTADPASPLFTNPDAFGATLTRQSLLDFYHDPSPHRPGYRTAYFSESQILDACNRLLQAAALPPSLDPIVDSSSSMSRNSLEIAPNPSKRVVLLVGMFRRIVPEGNDGPFGSQGGFVDNLAPSPYSLANGYLKSFVDANDALRERYDVRLFDIIEPWEPEEEREEVRITDEDIDALLSYHPVLIGFSAYCWNLDAVRTACQTIKQRQPDVRIVVGGRVSQSDARDWLASCPAVDAVVVGEGELAFREILLRDGFSGIAGVLWREGNELRWGGAPRCLDSLDDIPSPFLTGVLVPALHAVMLELSRGCLHACGYCTWNADKRLRHFGSSRIEQELRWAVRQGHQHITLNDSAINYDTERLRDFVEAIERADPSNRLRFTYNFRHDALTEEQFELFQRLPTHVALVGVETLSSRGMAQVDRQAVDVPALRYRLERFARTV
ncbi:MAG TPA: cobalamin-dependent protein, partial [Polyangiaceae bacterium]|nr:cobalamin-dependent protein [Polyangiaceae bacterium]